MINYLHQPQGQQRDSGRHNNCHQDAGYRRPFALYVWGAAISAVGQVAWHLITAFVASIHYKKPRKKVSLSCFQLYQQLQQLSIISLIWLSLAACCPIASAVNVTIDKGQTGVYWAEPAGATQPVSYAISGADASKFKVYGTGLVVTEGAPLAPGTYNCSILATDAAAVQTTTSIALTCNCVQVPTLRSKYARDITAFLAFADNTVSITPASYANWTDFLTANAPLTGKVILLGEGDYTGWGQMIFGPPAAAPGDGTAIRPVVIKYNGDNASLEPRDRPNDQAIIQGFAHTNADHYLYHGLTIDPTGAAASPWSCGVDLSDDVIVDSCWWPDTDRGGVSFRDFVGGYVQFCRIERHTHQENSDRIGFASFHWTKNNYDFRVVGTTSRNMTQLVQCCDADVGAPLGAWQAYVEGCVICDNFGTNTDPYLNSGTPAQLHIEGATAHKTGASEERYRHLIRGNLFSNWCQKLPDTGVIQGDGCNFIRYSKFIDVHDNVFCQCEKGIFVNAWNQLVGEPAIPNVYANREVTVRRNSFIEIREPATQQTTNDGACLWTQCPTIIDSNTFRDSDVSSVESPGVGSNTWTNNTHINVLDATER